MIGILLNMGRHTISRAIETIDHAQQDWSALYRLFERNRVNLEVIQTMIRRHVQEHNGTSEPLVAFIDDTVLRKRGRKVHGTSWKLDPLGPKFSNNFIWAQRYMQISLARKQEPGHCRGIPILFQHCPVPEKPGKNASQELLQEYKRVQKKMRLPQRASEAVSKLQECAVDRKLIIVADGGYTNQTVCRSIVGKHVYIGRMRKDAKLFASPCVQNSGKGRKRYYGDQLPTPEEIRQTATDWSEVTAYTGNGMHTFKIIAVAPVRSKVTGDRDVKVIIIQPLRYRLTSHSPLLYRNAAYLLCTDPDMPNEKILQYYLWRWEIELNFKDEKSILGIHQAQVRTPNSVESFPGFVAAAYSLFLLAASDHVSQYPKWRAPKTVWRTSTNMMLANFRIDALTADESGFTHQGPLETKPLLFNLSWKNVIQAAAN